MPSRPPPPPLFSFRLSSPGSSAFSFSNLAGKVGGGWEAQIEATCQSPEKFAPRDATILLTGTDELDDRGFLGGQHDGHAMGSFSANKNAVEASLYVPASAVPLLMGALAARQIEFLTLQVEEGRLQHARVSGYYFEGPAHYDRDGPTDARSLVPGG